MAKNTDGIKENHSDNVNLYNKYLIFTNGVFITVLFAKGFSCEPSRQLICLRVILVLLLLSLFATVLELGLQIMYDGIQLNYIKNKYVKCITKQAHNYVECIILFGFLSFLMGLIVLLLFAAFALGK